MVTSIGSATLAQTSFTPVKKTQQEEQAAAAAGIAAAQSTTVDDAASTGATETVSALSSATARVGDQLAAQADAARVDRARAEAPPADGPPPAEETEASAETGSAAPAGARPAGGGGGAKSTSETESTDYIAEADTNSDKTVSDEERVAYEKKLEQQAQDKSGAVQKAYGLAEESEPAVSETA